MQICCTPLDETDKVIYTLIENEKQRLNSGLELIASENFASRAVLDALGSTLTNKYSEGYPKKRYYGGNEVIDEIEQLAIERAKNIFGAEHVNVQPYSGSIANLEVYLAFLEMGDKIMGMNLAHGGHLTHGHPVNLSGKLYNFTQYGVDKNTKMIDYDEVLKIAREEKPKLLMAGATAYPRTIDFKRFNEITEEVGAVSMADISHVSGLIVGGVHPSPFPETDVVTTTTHKTLRGPRGAIIMCRSEHAQKVDKAVFPGMQGGPHNHLTAAKAVCFQEANTGDFRNYTAQILKNSKALAEELLAHGMDLVSGGTDNHMILIDLTKTGHTGKDAEIALDKVCITVNKNMVPFDTGTPFNPSGIRIGTPAVTTRGMKESEMKEIGRWIAKTIANIDDGKKLAEIRADVCALSAEFRIY